MSIVRQLAKAKAREEEKRRTTEAEEVVESVNVNDENTGLNTTDPLHAMVYTETCLGAVDFQRVQDAVHSAPVLKRGKYLKYTDRERHDIGKYASEHGTQPALRKFKDRFPTLNESTVRTMRKKYQELLEKNSAGITKKAISNERRGRPLMLGGIDTMVQSYLKALRARGGHVSRLLAEATAIALIENHPEMNLGHIDLESTSWSRSLFDRMGFVSRAGTTAKVPISEDLKQEIELTYLHDIVKTIEEFNIPPSLVINLDQTPSKYVPGSKSTLDKRGTKNVPIAGSSDKRMITLTFAVTLDGKFLPMQIIYGGKTKQSLPRGVKFPSSFSLSCNPKHYSNEKEALKHLDEIIIPYIEEERERLDLPDQVALLIMDVFKGQMTDPVFAKLDENDTKLKKVPANFTYLYQPLDAQGSVNVFSKMFMKKRFTQWYSNQVIQQIDMGKDISSIDIKFRLTTMKPLHAKWLIELYNYLTSPEGKEICMKGWMVTGIYDAVQMTLKNLPTLDPFNDIDPLFNENEQEDVVNAQAAANRIYVAEEDYADDADDEFECGDDETEVQLFEDEYEDESEDEDGDD